MGKHATRAFYVLLAASVGGGGGPGPGADCLPYTKPPNTAASVALSDPLVRVAANEANATICEEMT